MPSIPLDEQIRRARVRALALEELFKQGLTREEVREKLGLTSKTFEKRLYRARQDLGRDMPGDGASRSPARTKDVIAELLSREERKPPRCPRCRLILGPDGCIDCPFDPSVRAELFSRRRSDGASHKDVR